jgi:hypothetical protein
MTTECIGEPVAFQGLEQRQVVADFTAGAVTSDAGGLLLREVAEGSRILRSFAECFEDHRNGELIEHSVLELVAQRVYALALGYEDVNDHDELRRDPLLATLVGKADPTGQCRRREGDRGNPLAGKSTINRLELADPEQAAGHRYHRIVCQAEAVDRFFVDVFVGAYETPPRMIVLDLDATDDPLHGEQEGRFFHGYYGCYCYLPLYIFAGDHLLLARLRPSNIDAAAGALEELCRIVEQIRSRWSQVSIIVRGDSGFARDEIMSWCEGHRVDYVFGLQKNPRLCRAIERQLKKSRRRYQATTKASRRYRDFRYRTRESWGRSRRVVGKAEYLAKGENPRFVVTSLSKASYSARALYEELYCARGDMENRIKEQQLDLFADRTSTSWLRSNQLRLWFSSVAYVLMSELRRVGLKGTELERAQCSTIRNKLLKIGALVSVTVRRVWVRFASGYPFKVLFAQILANLRRAYDPIRA